MVSAIRGGCELVGIQQPSELRRVPPGSATGLLLRLVDFVPSVPEEKPECDEGSDTDHTGADSDCDDHGQVVSVRDSQSDSDSRTEQKKQSCDDHGFTVSVVPVRRS